MKHRVLIFLFMSMIGSAAYALEDQPQQPGGVKKTVQSSVIHRQAVNTARKTTFNLIALILCRNGVERFHQYPLISYVATVGEFIAMKNILATIVDQAELLSRAC